MKYGSYPNLCPAILITELEEKTLQLDGLHLADRLYHPTSEAAFAMTRALEVHL